MSPILSFAFLLSLVSRSASQGTGFSLTLLDSTTYPLARCLDGSQPGFYFQKGYGSGANSWLVHTQGGGWCVNDEDCLGRSKSALGSSSSWGKGGCPDPSSPVCYADGGDSGMLSNSSQVNPLLYNWNKVFIGYCDGASYASSRTDAIQVGGATIYYRGWWNLQGIYDELFASFNLGQASTVVVAGCSAGGLAVYIHLDWVKDRINKVNASTRVVGAPGAGFFLGEAAPFQGNGYLSNYQWVFNNGNMSSSLNDACIQGRLASNDTWKCFIAPEVLPYITTPLWVSNSLTDQWQSGNIMGLGCSPTAPGKCTADQMTYLENFRGEMLAGLAPVLSPSSPHGGFLQACFVHVVEDVGSWATVKINNLTQAETFAQWLQNGKPNGLGVDTFPPWSNPTC